MFSAVVAVVALPSCVIRTEVAGPEPGATGSGVVPEDLPPGVRYTGPGSEATTYLRSDTDRIIIEVDQVEGIEISSSSLSHLQEVLGSVADKPVDVETSTIPSTASEYLPEDLRTLEQEHRDTFTDGDTASMYILALDGTFRDQGGIIGVAYSGSSCALFAEEAERRGVGDFDDADRADLADIASGAITPEF